MQYDTERTNRHTFSQVSNMFSFKGSFTVRKPSEYHSKILCAHQALLSMGFSRQEYWSESPFPPSRYLPDPEIKPASPATPELAGRFFTTEPPGKIVQKILVCLNDENSQDIVKTVYRGKDDYSTKLVCLARYFKRLQVAPANSFEISKTPRQSYS